MGARGGARSRTGLHPRNPISKSAVGENKAAKLVQQHLEQKRPSKTIITTDRHTFSQFGKLRQQPQQEGQHLFQFTVPDFSLKKIHLKWSSTKGAPTSREIYLKVRNQAPLRPDLDDEEFGEEDQTEP